MRLRPGARSLRRPLGTGGDWRRRLLRHHVPLALASAVVLILFMTLPLFARQGGSMGGPMDHAGGNQGSTSQSEGQQGPAGHGGQQAGSAGHGGDEEGQASQGPAAHGGDQQGPESQGEDQQGAGTHGGDQSSEAAAPPDAIQSRGNAARLTVATGYVATGLLAVTLLIGPANLLLRRRNPVSSYLRRDVGTWTAVASVVHVIYGLQVHGTGQLSDFLVYFFAPDGSPLTDSFGLGNWTGLGATVIVVGLLALSSNFALRKLRAGPWKRFQRLNYVLFGLVIAHAFYYGALSRLTSPFTLLLGLSVVAVFVGQAVGIWLWRRRYPRHAVAAP
jgi:sulfoxide reductase heme-binding subunit YedZ